MAPLIEEAVRVRRSAAQARAEALALRAETRLEVQRSLDGRGECDVLCLRARRLRRNGYASPWSDLRWSPPGRDLDGVLELVA